jgi:hypothetical protein
VKYVKNEKKLFPYNKGVILVACTVSVGRCEERKERRKCGTTTSRRGWIIFCCVLWNCLMRHLGPSGVAGILASTGTPLLDYKRGVPVARPPHWEGVGVKTIRE